MSRYFHNMAWRATRQTVAVRSLGAQPFAHVEPVFVDGVLDSLGDPPSTPGVAGMAGVTREAPRGSTAPAWAASAPEPLRRGPAGENEPVAEGGRDVVGAEATGERRRVPSPRIAERDAAQPVARAEEPAQDSGAEPARALPRDSRGTPARTEAPSAESSERSAVEPPLPASPFAPPREIRVAGSTGVLRGTPARTEAPSAESSERSAVEPPLPASPFAPPPREIRVARSTGVLSRTSSPATTRASRGDELPEIRVSIGRIELAAIANPPPARRAPVTAPKPMSLSEYEQKRGRRGR